MPAGRLSRGGEGRIVTSGPFLFAGYLSENALNQDVLDDGGFFDTGDLGSIDAAGYLRITGRVKNVIRRGAETIPAALLEDVVASHPDVVHAIVVGVPDQRLGEIPVACVQLRPDRKLALERHQPPARARDDHPQILAERAANIRRNGRSEQPARSTGARSSPEIAETDMNVDAGFESLLHQVVGTVGIAVLNRPAVLNVIDMKLIKALHKQLEAWRAIQAITAVLVRGAGERAFCAGGDVRAVYEHRGDDAFMHEVYHVEYILDDAIARYSKPYIVLMSGIVMGGGCGISVHGSHRVVTETTQLAMPECRIGLFPDIGASYFLARCPGELGLYLALTGARIGAADALYLGLADYFVPTERLPEILPALAGGN